MPRLPETNVTLGAEEALFSVNNFCTDNYKCQVKSTMHHQTLVKVQNNDCAAQNISVPIRFSTSNAYYAYCGANQAKVMFYANKSFYTKDNKFKYVPFTATQTDTSVNFPLEVLNPYMKNEICNFQIKTTDAYKDTCAQVGDGNKCYKYCGGATTLVSSGQNTAAASFLVNITTRHGHEEYKITSIYLMNQAITISYSWEKHC